MRRFRPGIAISKDLEMRELKKVLIQILNNIIENKSFNKNSYISMVDYKKCYPHME